MAASGYRVHTRFNSALRKLPEELLPRYRKVIAALIRDPEAIRQDKGCKKLKSVPGQVFEYRLNDGWRITFTLQPNREPYLLLLGDHDSIIEDTRRLVEGGTVEASDSPAVGSGGTSKPVKEKPEKAAYVPKPIPGPFAKLSVELLRFWKIPEAVIPVLKALPDKEEALKLGGLSAESQHCLLTYVVEDRIIQPDTREEGTLAEVAMQTLERAQAGKPAEVGRSGLGITREQLLELEVPEEAIEKLMKAKTWEDIEEVSIPVRLTQRLQELVAATKLTGVAPEYARDLYAEDDQVLEDVYRGNIKKLLLFLTPEQRPLVDLPLEGVHMVKGVAGSGKTTVALYRVRRLRRENPNARVFFVAYNKSLVKAADELLRDILTPAERDKVYVDTFDAFVLNILRREGSVKLVKDRQQMDFLRSAIAALAKEEKSRLLDRDAVWFEEEIAQIIKGRDLKSREEYYAVERSGRSTALPEAGRRLVWEVYERYQRAMADRVDFDDLAPRALRLFQKPGFQPPDFDYVVIDEAQDLSPAELRVLIMAAKSPADGRQPGVFVVADAAQSIYQRGFRWKDMGVAMHASHVHVLKQTHRNTQEILCVANALLEKKPNLRDDGELRTVCGSSPRRGPKPKLVYVPDADQEAEYIAGMIEQLRHQRRIPWGNFACLSPKSKKLENLEKYFTHRGIPNQYFRMDDFKLGDDTVKLITLHSSKGLEFPVVFLFDINEGVLPKGVDSRDDEALEEEDDRARKLLYVGMTRAMQELFITTSSTNPSPLLTNLPSSSYERFSYDRRPVRR